MYRENIDKYIAQSMKNGEHLKLSCWKAIKNEFVKVKTSATDNELTDEKELSIIKKMVQQRKESYEIYLKANRSDLANSEKSELDFLSTLLPKEPTTQDIEIFIKEYISTKNETPTIKDMKNVMSFVKSKSPMVDGSIVAKIFKENYI